MEGAAKKSPLLSRAAETKLKDIPSGNSWPLGRQTREVNVDIDLGKEGKANKISRRQAVNKMGDSGSVYITNTGKCSIFVNSKEVPCNKRMSLISDSLLEELSFLRTIKAKGR